jgi:type I restriction enzyme S subunit
MSELTFSSDWTKTPVLDLFYVKGRLGWKGLRADEFRTEGPYLITGTDFDGGKVDWTRSYRISDFRFIESPEIAVHQNDVLITKDGTIGKVVLVDEVPPPGKASLNSHLFLVRSRTSSVSQSFAYRVFTSAQFRHYIEIKQTGSTLTGLPQRVFEKFDFPVPDLAVQRRIATILTTLDEVIEATEKLVEKHQQIKAGLMHDLFTRGLWTRPELTRGDHKGLPCEATAQEGQLRPPPEEAPGLYRDSPLGPTPKEWEVDRAGNLLARIEQGWSPDCESVPPEGDEWGVLKTSAVVWDGFDPRESKRLPGHLWPRSEYKVSKGDVLMTRAGPNSRVGVVALVDTSEGNLMISDKIYRCVPNARVEPDFLALAFTSEGTQHILDGYKTGLAESQTNISQAIVRKLWVPLPKAGERTSICHLEATATNQLRSTTTHLAKLRQQKQGLMHDLLTGRVRVG